jgi:hypothetical protein
MMNILHKLITFLIATLALTMTSFGQLKSDQIKTIRNEFQAINSDTTLKKVTLENEEFLGENIGDGGGELTGFFKGKTIKKIHLWLGLSNGIEIKEYYFNDGQLIFVYEKFKTFGYDQKKGQMDYDKTTTTFEGRYYFNNQKLIDQKEKGQNRNDDERADPGKVLLAQANNHLNLLIKKK